jgi:hypothetical protein
MPAAAEQHMLLVTLAGGKTVTVTVDVPPGTPLSAIQLPSFGLPVVSVQDITPPPAQTTPPAKTTPGGQQTTPAQTPQAGGSPTRQGVSPTGTKEKAKRKPKGKTVGALVPQRADDVKPTRGARGQMRTSSGQPTVDNPTFSFAASGPAPIGVPNFFIEKFRIPPFLLPIYQAAGTEYGIPWQVLAAINEIETDYGRNLSVSSAGALGWMQFIPSSWRTYGVDANGDGIKDPYNPVDAIFAAARYLRAAGGDQNLSKAIFAYNHADWYVQSVELRAKLIGGMPADLVGSLTGLTQGHFPVAATATYADDLNEARATRRVRAGNAAVPDAAQAGRRSTSSRGRALR